MKFEHDAASEAEYSIISTLVAQTTINIPRTIFNQILYLTQEIMQVSSAMEEQDGEMVVKRLSVPVGLEELMTGLTREVLQKKPKDLYTFASEHFGQLLALRDNGNYRNPPSRSFAFYDQDDMENRTPNGNLRKSRSVGGSGRQLSRQVSIRAESPARKSRIRRSGTPKHDDNNNSEGKTKAKQDKSKPARRQTPGSKSKFDNLEPVKEGALKVVAKKENLSKRSTDKKSKDTSGSKDSKRSSSEESEKPKKKGENFRETKDKFKTKRKEAGEGSAKFVPKSSSVEEATTGIKDGRLTVTPPKIIKEAQSPTDQLDLPTTLVVPVLTAASSCLSVDAGKKESGQDEDIRKALKNDSETGEILSVSKEDSQDSSSKNYDSSTLKEELKKVEEEAKLNNFTTSYNPYKLRQEIKNASKEGDDNENIDALGTESAAGETQSPHVNLTPNLQHSGELHDTVVPQEGSAEDSTDDQNVLEDKEELNSKVLKKIAHIGLQHSGELHDSLIPKEKETVKEGESMEAVKTPIQLQHSSELHDTVISKETENIDGEIQEKVETLLGLQQEKVTVKEDKPMEAIKTPIQLQHSSEMHDTVISKETENINGESQEKVETALALQHPGKLHDAVISEDIITEDEKDKKIPNVQVSESPTASPEKETSVAESTFASAVAAATKIQSLWRGFRVRKIGKAKVHQLVDQHNVPESEISGNRRSLSDDDIMQAATKIQAGVRGYLTRKQQRNKISATKENASADEELHKALAQLDNAPIPSESPELARRKRETQMDISDNAVVKADDREENSTATDKLSRSKSVRELGSGKLNVPAFSKSVSVTDSAISKTLDDDEEKLRSLTEDTESLCEQTEDLGIGSEMSSTQQLDQGKITEEVLPDISQVTENKKIVEEPEFVTENLSPLHHSGELHDTVVHKESKQIDDSSVIPQDGESIQELPSKILPPDILKEQMTPKQLPELASTSDLQHSGELHDLLIPQETNITDQDPQKDNLSSPPLQHSGEIHDTVIMNKSDEQGSVVDDDQLAEIKSQVEQPYDISTTNENKQTSEEEFLSLIGLQHSGELRDIVMSKKNENGSSGNYNGLAIPQLSTEQGDKSTVNESDIAKEDTGSPPYTRHHSSELHDTVVPKKVEENKDIKADANLITPNSEIPKESPETNGKNDSESLPLEHGSKLYEDITTKENEENKDIEEDAGFIATSPQLAVKSSDISKIKDPETNAKDSSKSISLEHSSELHDAVIPKGSEKNKDIQADTGLIAGSPQLAEESPDTAKLKETETHAKCSSESLSLKHSSELHDAVIPKGSEENKVIQADTGFLTVSPQLAVESPATLNENEENKDIEENVDLIAASPHLAEDTLKIKETSTNAKDNPKSISLEHNSELHDTAIPKVSEENKDIQVDSGLIAPSPHFAEESAVTLKIKETETNTKGTPKLVSLEHSSELHDVITPKGSEENKDIQADAGLVAASPHLDEESPDTSKQKETETNGKGSSESTSLEHSSELHDAIIEKPGEENKYIQAQVPGLLTESPEIAKESPDTSKMKAVTSNENEENKEILHDVGLIAAKQHLAEETPDISKIEKTETNAKGTSESASLELSSELQDDITQKGSEENKDIQADTGLLAASSKIAKESPDTSEMQAVTSNENKENKDIQQDVGLIAANQHLTEQTDISKIEETETNAKDATSLEHSSELHDDVTPKESEKNKNIETDTDLIAASPYLAEESSVTSKIKDTETNGKDAPESNFLEHSSELHDVVIPKESEKSKHIEADTDLIAASPHLNEELPVTSKIIETETNANDTFESTSLEHSSELYDAATTKESEKNKNIEADTAASSHLAEESPVASKIMETEKNAKDTFESTSLEHSSELHDAIIGEENKDIKGYTPKECEKNKNIEADTDLIAASPHLAEELPVTSKIIETETNTKDSCEAPSLEHSSELHDAVTSNQSEKNKNIEADTDLIAASPHLAEELPVTSKIIETETNTKDSCEATSLEHSSELHDAVTSKESEKNKNIEADTDLIAASPHLAEESPVASKIMETETNAKDTFESTSLEHSSELHDAVIGEENKDIKADTPKECEKNKNIEADTDLIAASPHLAEELPVTSKIIETETNTKDSCEATSLEHSSELHDAVIPKESEKNKNIEADTDLIAASPHLAEESPVILKIIETETNAKDTFESTSLEHSSELHDAATTNESEKNQNIEADTGLIAASPHLAEKSPVTSKIMETETNAKDAPELTFVEHSSEYTSELTNDLVPITIAEEKAVEETQKLSMQGLPHEEESQDTMILNKTEKDSEKASCKDIVTPNKIKESENSNNQDNSTPVAIENGSEITKITAASTVDEQKTIKENQNLVAMSPQLAEESHATSSVNEVEKVSEGGSPTSIILQHSSELHDPVISPALTEVKEIEKPVAVQQDSEVDNTLIPDTIEKENVIQERERLLVTNPQSTEKPDDTATTKEHDQNREEDSPKSVLLQHRSELHDTMLTDGVKEEKIVSEDKSLITASPLLIEKSNDSLAINKMGKAREEDSSKTSVLQNSSELYDSAIPDLVEKEKITQEDKSLVAASPQFSKETHSSLTANKTDNADDNSESTTLHHSSELHDTVLPNDTNKDQTLMITGLQPAVVGQTEEISEDIPTTALQHSSEVRDAVVAKEAAVSTIASLQLTEEPHDVSKIEEIGNTDEEGKSTLSTSRHHSSEIHDSKIPNQVKNAESGNMFETPQSNNELGDASEVKPIKSGVKDDNDSEIDVMMADSTDENKYIRTAEVTEEKHKQSPATTLRYDDVLSNDTEKHQTSKDDKHVSSAILLPTEGMHNKFDKNSIDKTCINHESLNSTDIEQDDALLNSNKHQEGTFQNDDDLAITSPQLTNQPFDIETAKESGKADEMDQTSLTMLQHSSELHDTLIPIAICKETLQDNTKLITEDPKTTDDGLTEHVIDTSDKKDKSSQPPTNELNKAALPNVSLEEPLASDKSVPTITPQLGENLQDNFEVKKSDLAPSSLSHSSELDDTVKAETVDNTLQKRYDDLKVEESQTAKMHQKNDTRSVVPIPSADTAADLLVPKESDQNEEENSSKDVETSKTSEQQNNTLEDDVHLPASIDVEQQKQIDETPKRENLEIASLQHSSELHDILIPKGIEERNLQSDNLMSKAQDKDSDVISKENVEEKYEESHLNLLAADPHGAENGGLITSEKEDPDVSIRKKIDEFRQTSGDRKSASNDTTRESGNLERNVEQQDLEPKNESHVDHEKGEDVKAIIPTEAYSKKDNDSLSPKETEQEPTNSLTAVPDLNEPTNLQHSGELHDLTFPSDDFNNKSNIDNNHVLRTTKLQSEKDGDGHQSPEHDNESSEAPPASSLQHSGEFHDLLIPQADNSKQEEVKNSAVTSAEDTFENKIGVDDATKPNGDLVTETLNVGEQTGENSIKLQEEGSAVKDSEDRGQSADGSKTLAAQNQVQNVEVEKDNSNGHDIILNKQISSSVLDVPLECEAPTSSTAAASGALSDDVQRDNYNLHHKTDEEAKGQPLENLNSLSPIQDPHLRNTENRKDAPHNLDVDIQKPKQSSTELTTEELLSPHENINAEEDQNKLDSEENEVKETLQNIANHPSTHIIDVKENDVNDVNNKNMKNKDHNHEELHSKTEEFDKNLNKELEPPAKQGGHISSDFDMTALRAELISIESQIENATNGSTTDNIEGEDNKLEEPVSSKTFNIAQLHSELENIVATQPDGDKHEITESDIIKNNVSLENAPTPKNENSEELNSITRVIDGQKDALSEITQSKARDNSLSNEDSTAENKSKESETEVLSNGDTHSKIEDKHEEKAVGTNLASDSSDINTVADKAILPNIEDDEQNDISLESMKENTLDDDISGLLKPLLKEELEEKELEKISTEVRDVLKDIKDYRKISDTKALNDDGRKVDDKITEDKQSSKTAQDKQQSPSSTEKNQIDYKNSTEDTSANRIGEGVTKQEITEFPLQNINSDDKESMEAVNAENIPSKTTSNGKKEIILTSTKESPEEKIEENFIKDDNASNTFDMSKLRAELEQASDVLQSEANLKEDTAVEDLRNQQNQVQNKIKETVNTLSIEDDKTESSKGVVDNAMPLKTSPDKDDSIAGKENLEKTLIPNSTNPSTFDISTLRTELEEIEKQIETNENETNTTDHESGEISRSKIFDISKLQSELENLETDENEDKSTISNDIDKLNKTNENDFNKIQETANQLSQDKTKNSASEGSANVSESSNLSSPPHAVESKSEKASTNESLAIDYESAPTRPVTSDITPSISLNENIQIPSDNVYKHAQATDLEPHNSAEIITSGSFKGEGNDKKIDLGLATIKRQNDDVHINDKINEANFKGSMLKSFSVAEFNTKDELENATKDKLKLEEEIERPVSISSTTSTDSVGTVIFNASSPREIDDDAESHFEMRQGNESQKSKDNKSNLHLEEAKPSDGSNTADDRRNYYEVVPDNNTPHSQAIHEMETDDVKENNANSKDVKLINRSPVIPVEVTPGTVNAFDKGTDNNVTGRTSDLEEKVDSVDGSNASAVTASENNAISGKETVPQEATSTKDLDTNKANVSTINETTFIEGSNGYTAQQLDINKVNSIKIPQSNLQKEASNEDQDVAHALKVLVTPKKSEVKPIESTVIANVQNEDNSNTKHMITNNLDVVQSIESNEKPEEIEIVRKSEDIFKESNHFQEIDTHKDSQIKTNEDTIIAENTIQTTIKEPEISKSKLPHAQTPPTDFTKRNDEDADVLANIEPVEKNKASEIQNSDEELILQGMETNKDTEIEANERNIDNNSLLTKQDGLNSEIVDKNKEAKKPENTLSQLAPDETTSDVKNEKIELKDSVPDHQETIKENNDLQEITASKVSEANASEDNIITENDFQITKQNEMANKNVLTEDPEIAASKLTLVGTSLAKLENKDNKEAITTNLHGEQNIEPNEKDDANEISKESNNLQEGEINRKPGEANESNRTTDSVFQIPKPDQMSAEIVSKNELQEEPKITSSKLPHVETFFVNVTNKNDKDVVIPNFDVAQNTELNEKVEVKETVLSPEEIPKQTNDLKKIETNQSSEVKANKDDITNADASQITKQNEMKVEPVSKRKLTEVSEITLPKLAHVQTSAFDITHKDNKDIVTPNLGAVENIEANKKVDFKEIAPNSEETLKATTKLQEIKANKSPEAKPDEDDSTETVPQITIRDEISSENVSKRELTEEPKMTSSKFLPIETSPVDVKNNFDKDIVRPNFDTAENIATNRKVDVNKLAPNAEETFQGTNNLQELEAEKSSEVKANEGNIITETAPQITTQDEMNSESISNNKPTEEPKISSSKSVLVETSPADIKNRDDKDIPTPNLNVAENTEVNKKVDVKEVASNPRETLKEFNNLQEIEATRRAEVIANKDNPTTATAPQITTLDEINAGIVNKHKPTEEPKITSPVETSPGGVKNKDDKDMSTPSLDVAENIEANKNIGAQEIASNPEKTLNESNNLQEIEANKTPAVKANKDNLITKTAPQITTQDEMKVESKNKLTEEPQIASSKLRLVEESPDLKNEDDEDIVTPNLGSAQNTEQNKKTKVKQIALSPQETLKETNDLQEIEAKNISEVKANEDNIIIENASQITIQDEINSESTRNIQSIKEPKNTSATLTFPEASPVDLKNKDDKHIVTHNLEANKKIDIKEIVPNLEETFERTDIEQKITANNSPELKANKDNIITANDSPIATQDGMNSESVNNNKLTEAPPSTSAKLKFVKASSVDLENKDDKDIVTPNLGADEKVDIKEIASNPEEPVEGTNIEREIKANKSLEVKANKDNIITANDSPIATQDEMISESVNNNKLTEEPPSNSAKLTFVEASPVDLEYKDDKDIVTPNLGADEKVDIKEIVPNPTETVEGTNIDQEIKANKSLEVKANKDNIITANDSPIATQDEMNSESANNNKLTEKPPSTSAKLTFVDASPVDLENKDDKDIVTPNLGADEKVDIKEIVPNPKETVEGTNIEQEIKANKSLEVKANKDNMITANDSPIATQDETNSESVSNNKTIEEPKLTSAKLILVEESPTDLKNKNDEGIVTPALKVANEKVDIKEIAPNSEESFKEINNLQESKASKSLEVEANEDNIITENDSPITKQHEINSESVSKNDELKGKPEITLSKLPLITSSTDVKNKGDKDNFTPNLDAEENIEANEKVGIKAISSNPEEANKSAEVKANEDNTTTESDSRITKQDEMTTTIARKNEVKEEPEIISSKLAVVETSPGDVKNKDDQSIFSPNLDIAENIEPKEKDKPKEIAPNLEESLESNNLQEIEENKSSEVRANEDHTITENTSQINKQNEMNDLEEKPENISSKLASIKTSPDDVKNYDKDMITPNSQFTEENKMNYGIVSKNEQEEESHITSAKSVPVETSPDIRNDNENLDVAQNHEPHEAAGVKETVSNTKEIINNNKATSEIVKNNGQEKDIEKKGDRDAIITDLNVAEHIELNEKPEIKKVVQDPEKSNNLQVVETNKDINIKTNEESTTAENFPPFIIKEDVNTTVTGKDKQEETPKTTSSDLALTETLYPDSRKNDDKDIKDNITDNINKDVKPNERKQIEKAEPIRELPLEIKNEPIDKSTDMKLQEKFLKNNQEAELSENNKTMLEAVAIEELASKENNHEMGKTTKEHATGINDEDLSVEEQDLVQDKKSDENRLDNSVTLLQEQGAHLNQHGAATKIQSGYRGYRVRRSLTMPLLETSSSKISNDSDEVDEHIKNTLLHVEYDNNKTIQEAEVPSKIDLSPDVNTQFLNTDTNLASADLNKQKKTFITPGDPKKSEDIRLTSPPTALMNFEDEDGSYDPFKHASAPPLSLLEHEEEFDLHNQSMLASHPLEETHQTDELPKPSDSKEKQRTAVDRIMDVASAPTHLLTSKSVFDNKLSHAVENNNASPSQKAKEGDIHVSSVELPEGVSPRFHNDKDGPVTQALEIVLDQQLALATPSAVKKEESAESEGPEYIYIPLKDPNVSSPSKSLSERLQHSGEYHDSVVVPLLINAPPKEANIDATSLAEPKEEKIDDEHAISSDSITEDDEDSSKYDLVDNHKSPRTQIENEGAVTKALGAVLDQQLAITAPKAKPKEEESLEEPKYIYIPLKDPNQESSFDEKDLAETKHEEGVSEQEGDKPVLVPVRHYETIPQKETKIEVHNVEKQQEELSLTKTIDVTPNTSFSEEVRPDTESKIVSSMQQIQTNADVNNEGVPASVNSSVVKEDESHSSLTQSIDTTPKTSSSEEAQPLTESKTEVLTTTGQFEQSSGATALVLSSNLADASSSPVVITHQPSAIRSGSADIRATIPPGTPTLGLQVRFSPSPTQNVEQISASVSPIAERREGSHSTQEDRSVQSESPPLVIQTTQISDVLPVAVQLNQPPGQVFIIIQVLRS